MAYDIKLWRKRYIERSDLTTELVHLTRSKKTENKSALEVLFAILQSKKLLGSTTSSGFIVGDTLTVCFQDAPLSAVGQNWGLTNYSVQRNGLKSFCYKNNIEHEGYEKL